MEQREWYETAAGREALDTLSHRLSRALELAEAGSLWHAVDQLVEWLMEADRSALPPEIHHQISVRIRMALKALEHGDRDGILRGLRLAMLLTGEAGGGGADRVGGRLRP